MLMKSWKLLGIFLFLQSPYCFSLLMEKNMFVKQELYIWIYLTKRSVKFMKMLSPIETRVYPRNRPLLMILSESLLLIRYNLSCSYTVELHSLKKHIINIQACFLYCSFLIFTHDFAFKHCFSILQFNHCYISRSLIIYIRIYYKKFSIIECCRLCYFVI